MVVGAVIVGYVSCLIHQGLGRSFFSRFLQSSYVQEQPNKEERGKKLESVREEQGAAPGLPSFSQLVVDLSKLALEMVNNGCASLIPSRFSHGTAKRLMPLKDTLKMPEDKADAQLAQRQQRAPPPVSESWQAYASDATDKYSQVKTSQIRPSSLKDPSLSSRHRSSKHQEYAEFYETREVPHHSSQTRSKSQKERSKHRHRDKSGEVAAVPNQAEPKPSEFKAMNYSNPKFDPYNIGNRYMPDGSYRF